MFPKVVALDTDWTIFQGCLNPRIWGRGPWASPCVEDNIIKSNRWDVIHDKSNIRNKCIIYPDVPRIIHDILKNGAKLAIVSRNSSKAMCDRALWYWTAQDANGNERPIIDMVDFDEVYDACKTDHFSKIQGYTGFDYSDMILYDDDAASNIVEMMLGVTFQVSRNRQGLTWANYQHGLEIWQRTQSIRCPYPGLDLSLYPKKKLLGYSGMDIDTINLLEAGHRRHDRKEAARWGYAMYVADNAAIAKYFADWIKRTAFGPQAQCVVCRIYARDGDVFDNMPKIWIPDHGALQTDVSRWDANRIAWSQENRDARVKKWGVPKPYILFARHPNMREPSFPVKFNQRWNEMVVYPQVQETLIVIERMSDQELDTVINDPGGHLHYAGKLKAWNITVPRETWQDFAAHRENFRC